MENNMKWNKLRLRPLNDEEKEYYKDSKIESVWDGNEPEIGEEVLVYSSQYEGVTTDIWTDDFDYGVGFENTDDTVIYWMSFPEPPRIVSIQEKGLKKGLDMKMKMNLLWILYIIMLISIIFSLGFLFQAEFTISIFCLAISCVSWLLFGKIVEDIDKEWK